MFLDSLLYLTVADATVICFLAPLVSCLAYSFLLHEPVTSTEKLAGFVSFLGVIVIARPPFLFGAASSTTYSSSTNCGHAENGFQLANVDCSIDDDATAGQVTSEQRMSAIVVGLLGVCGAAVAYISIRWIGSRAHPLVSVNYLSVLSTLVSAICLLCVPGIGFRLPADTLEWAYLLSLGASGSIMQFLITEGLSNDKGGSRATNMVYTQLLFALAFDYIFLGIIPDLSSVVGNILILGSVLYLALYVGDSKVDRSVETRGGEEAGVVEGIDAEDEARGP
jgi:drug/metabolite transporter (DMT)-like permease